MSKKEKARVKRILSDDLEEVLKNEEEKVGVYNPVKVESVDFVDLLGEDIYFGDADLAELGIEEDKGGTSKHELIWYTLSFIGVLTLLAIIRGFLG